MTNSLVRGPVLAACALLGAAGAGLAAAAAPPSQIVIPGERLFTESLTSAKDGSVIVGSIGKQTIFRAKPGAASAEAWIQPGTNGLVSVFGVFADDKSNTLWACSGTPPFGPPQAGAPPPTPAALFAFDLKSGAPKGKYPLPTAGAFCNDIAVGPDGSVYATDAANMQVVRLKKGGAELEVWAQDGFGPKGGLLDGIAVLGNRVLVNTLFTSKLFSVPIEKDGKAGAATDVKLDRAIERPDGMRSFGKNSLLVIEGGGGGRLSKVTLEGDSGKTVALKEGFPDGPVAVTVVGQTAYVLEGQLAGMRGPPGGGTPAPAKPFTATAVEVGKP
jgi:sugar lactone lactonase YvrE